MNKILLVCFLAIVFCGCSTNDESEKLLNNETFFEATLMGETYRKDYYAGGITGVDNCNSDEDILDYAILIHYETSKFYLDADYVYPRYYSNWDKDEKPSSRILAENNLQNGCHEPFDFVLTLGISEQDEYLDESANNFNRIEKIVLVDEDSERKYYIIHGNYEITYKLEDGTSVPIKGKYAYPIDFIK